MTRLRIKQYKRNRRMNNCRICGNLKRIYSLYQGLCKTCYNWHREVGNPKITHIGQTKIFFQVGKYEVIFNMKKRIFESCTCKNEIYKGGACKHKSLCEIFMYGIGFMEDPIVVRE